MPQSDLEYQKGNDFDDEDETSCSSSGGNGSVPIRCAEHSTRLALLENSFVDQTKHLCEIKGSVGKIEQRLWYFVGTVVAAAVLQGIFNHFFK